MLKNRIALGLITITFAVLTIYALEEVGYIGIFAYHLPSPAGWQVFVDLCIALVLVMSWMLADAKRTGRTVWPFILATLLLGSFGPLAYLLLGARSATRSEAGFGLHDRAA